MKKISVAIIAKNEQEMIADCLKSVSGANEIIVCDTGSKDKTIEIARKFTKKVYTDYKWNDHFSEARNHSIDKCRFDWIFIIDCDEILEPGGIAKIRNLLNSGAAWKKEAIRFEVKTPLETINSIRLFRNKKEIRYKDAAHNRLEYFQLPANQDKILNSSIKIESRISPAHEKDPDRTLRILKESLAKQPNNDRYMYYIAREYANRRQPEIVLYYLNRYMKINEYKIWTNELADAYYLAALSHFDLKDYISGINYAIQCIKILPSFQLAWILLATAYQDVGNKNGAELFKKIAGMVDNKNVMFKRPNPLKNESSKA